MANGRLKRRRVKRKTRRHYGMGLKDILAAGVKLGVRLGRDKRYKRMGAIGATGHYRRLPRPWAR